MTTVETATNKQLLAAYLKLDDMEERTKQDEKLLSLIEQEIFCRGLGI